MIKNLKSDIESKNEVTHIESSNLESNRLESKRETSINIESKVDFNKRDSKSNDEVRLDSNNNEIMYEIWHNLTWLDYIMYSLVLFLGIIVVYGV